jgi:hypothetical protein
MDTILVFSLIFTYSFGAGVKIYVINFLFDCFLFFLFRNFILFKQLVRAYFIHLKYWNLKVIFFLIIWLNIFRFFRGVLAVIGLTWLLTLSYTSFTFTLRRLAHFVFAIAQYRFDFLCLFNRLIDL